jgi:hypothetical protein
VEQSAVLDGEPEQEMLAANRQGRLTPAQMERYRGELAQRGRRATTMYTIVAAVSGWLLILIWNELFILHGSHGIPHALLVAFAAAFVAAIFVNAMSRRNSARRLARIADTKVEVLQGNLTRINHHTKAEEWAHVAAYYAHIDGKRLYCEGDVGKRVLHFKGKLVRAYYLPLGRRIVSIEPVGPAS